MKALYTLLFVVGTLSAVLFGVWFLSGMLYALDSSIPTIGSIAYVPKWIFLFSPFVFLWNKKEVQEILEKVVFFFGNKEISLDSTSIKEVEEMCWKFKRIAVIDGDSQKITFKKGGDG